MVIEQAISNYLDWKVIRSPRAADVIKAISTADRISEMRTRRI